MKGSRTHVRVHGARWGAGVSPVMRCSTVRVVMGRERGGWGWIRTASLIRRIEEVACEREWREVERHRGLMSDEHRQDPS